MAVEITQHLREKLRLLSSNPNLESEVKKSINELQELQKSLASAVSVQVIDKKTIENWLKLVKDIYLVEDMIDSFSDIMIQQPHKGFNMKYNSESIKCWLSKRRLRKKIGKLTDKVIEQREAKQTESSSNTEAVGIRPKVKEQGQPSSSKAVGVRPKVYSEDKQATIGEDVQVSLECSLSDFFDGPISSVESHGQKWFEKKPVTIVLDDLVKKLAQPVLSRCMLQYLISKALVAFSSKAILLWAVYNSEDIKQYFQCIAWVHVRKESEATDILQAILEQVMRNKTGEVLHDFLVGKRYLIVLYGALTASIWNNLKSAFPFSFNGSRVILAIHNSSLIIEENGVVEEWPQPFNYLEDDSITIAITAAMSKLTQSILSSDRLLFLISIVGVGKSTLLWEIYDAKEVKQHFECCAWVHVQEEFEEIDVLVEIWKQIGVREIKLSLEPMRQMVCNFLAQKRYLIVLCDIWTSSVWESLKISLPNSLTGSRVILTVPHADIARETNSWVLQMTPGIELLPDLDLEQLHEDTLDRKVPQLWNSVSDIMENESEIIGMRDTIEELAKLALGSYRLHYLISVLGEAGSGKTTIVRAFYDSIATKQHFDCRAWITVPQEYAERDLLLDLLGQLMKKKQKQSLSIEQLQRRFHLFLNWKRYLIVLEDLETPQIWKKTLIQVLPNSSNGSRVILTLRKSYLAYNMNPPPVVLPLRPLNEDDSRKLFKKKVQNGVGDDDVPSDLMQRSRGLPLSIGLLAGRFNQQASLGTENIEGNDARLKSSDTEENPLKTLNESFKQLDFPLNHCLLHLGLFPRSYEIPIRRLLLIWLAEGLIIQPEGNTETLKELAMQRFVQLESRNLVQVVKWSLDGSPKTCLLPNALHDALSPNAEKFGFFHIHHMRSSPTASNSDTTPYSIPIRRLADGLEMFIHTKHEKHCMTNLRSYISFYDRKGDRPADGIEDLLKMIVKDRFGKLVVLDLEGVYKPALSEDIGRLPCLKYLGLRRTHLDSVPKSVAELPRLQSLDVKHTNVTTIPSTIWEVKKLQHLYMSEVYVDLSIQKGCDQEGSSTNLHTLWGLIIRGQIPKHNQLNRLVGVRELKLTCYESSMEVIDAWLPKLTNLKTLKLRSVRERHEPSILPLKSAKELWKLTKLYLLGQLIKPREILGELPRSLSVLTLSGSYLHEDPMETLAELKELKVLRLYGHSFLGTTMVCKKEFPKLEALKLWKLVELQQWTVGDGTMPVLYNLEIRYCNQLKEVDDLGKLTSLTKLTLTGMEWSVDYVKDKMGCDETRNQAKMKSQSDQVHGICSWKISLNARGY
ncbi:putative disease resistance RPP8-like protein 2 [Gossypium australe]|uniref:Putative disease resistance RPP8-like protein 2 n=1 Tax=Gossypium australe TaxID=47621 RepID=A0A5B6UGV1_9ROSI|nr:putative disease resistance RPP8-like protein 2 [Gossypium australe]